MPGAQTSDDRREGPAVWLDRHPAPTRVWHWVNAVCFLFLVWSGIGILIAYPRFHLGQQGYVGLPSLFDLPIKLDTRYTSWARPMHFSFAWLLVIGGLAYLAYGVISRRFSRVLGVRAKELSPANLLGELRTHLSLHRFRRPPEREYNLLQRLAYIGVLGLLLPTMLISGLALSPALVTALPIVADLFQGRQTARLVHFAAAILLVGFFVIHLVQVFATGFLNNIRAMVTGRYRLSGEGRG